MMDCASCPFEVYSKKPRGIPPVPAKVTTDIPFVPSPFQIFEKPLMTGGTTAPVASSWNQKTKMIYQESPPHPQNMSTAGNSWVNESPFSNEKPGECYLTNEGYICTSAGTDGLLYKQEKEPGIGGNANWVRGNQFSAPYNPASIEKRPRYIYQAPIVNSSKEETNLRVTYDPFYPVPRYCSKNNRWNKEYPHTKKYTESGYPLVKLDYDIIEENFEGEEDFMNMDDVLGKTSYRRICFWVVIICIFSRMYLETI
jgi:hypothetical protein